MILEQNPANHTPKASHGMQYNTQREQIVMSEYGRIAQNIVRHVAQMPAQEERTRYTRQLLDLMKSMNPVVREYAADNQQRVWDHLHLMADFKLDIDGPYPKPDPESFHRRPEPLGYPQNEVRYKHYGRHIENLIAKAVQSTNPEEKEQLTVLAARLMKNFYVHWNKEGVEDQVILRELAILSNRQLDVTPLISQNPKLLDISAALQAQAASPIRQVEDPKKKRKRRRKKKK